MRSIRGAVGTLALVLGAVGGCASEPGPTGNAAAPEQRASPLSLAGPGLVRDIRPTSASAKTPGSNPEGFLWVGDSLFFSAADSLHGLELWVSDGTEAGSRLVRDIFPGVQSGWPRGVDALDGKVFFTATDRVGTRLWRSDGTAGGTGPFVAEGPSGGFVSVGEREAVNGTLYLAASRDGYDLELWKSDGTPGGTVLVKDINPAGASTLSLMRGVNGTLFFTAGDGVHGRELWKSDGTPEGTVLVKDVTPGPEGTDFRESVAAGGGSISSSRQVGSRASCG